MSFLRTFLTAVRAELARITATRMSSISLIALMFIPVVYGGLYLWGNRDPYGALDRVPAALAVPDTGTAGDGAARNSGRAAADALVKAKDFRWAEVRSAARAEAGVRQGAYDFALVFPASFSRDLASASDTDSAPVTARLQLLTDDTNGYLSTTIAKQAAQRVAAEVARKLGRTASLRLLDGVADLRKGLSDAAGGAASLADGAASADSGAAALADGTAQLRTGATQLGTGAAALQSGLGALRSGTAALPAQAAQLASGAQQLSSGVVRVNALAAKSQADVAAALAASDVPAAQQAQLVAELAALSAATGSGSALGQGADQLAAGTAQLSAGAPALAQGVSGAADGAARLRAGADALETGAGSAASGAAQLRNGTAQLASGSAQLRDSLRDGAAKAPATTASSRAAIATAIAHPLDVRQSAYRSAENYGAGLAPFFLSLAAWIGIYALFLLVRPLSRRALTATRRPLATALAGWAVPAALGVLQMAGLFALVTLGLHLPVANPAGLLGFVALVAASYAAIVLALNVWLGSVGQFLGLLLMVVQLVTAGGTFPWQTLPAPLAALHQVLPMGYAVDGVRQLMYGASSVGLGGSALGGSILVLAAWLVASLAISVAGAAKQSGYRTLRELRPSAIGG
ncbi:MAG: ABC transporter permease [Micrococcales bacterium]|nr:ABC transporter permease [Micrococcales bacterium]